jgi:hypothetical protein
MGAHSLGAAIRGDGINSMGVQICLHGDRCSLLTRFTLFFTQVLFFHGSKIRSRSKVSRKILEAEQQEWDSNTPVVASPIGEKSMQA